MSIKAYLGDQNLGVLAHSRAGETAIHICAVYPRWDDSLRVFFPKGHNLMVGDFATIHLDNRTGVDEFDENIRVYRASYKGIVTEIDEEWAWLAPRECLLVHGMSVVQDIRQPGYRYPEDPRPERPLPASPLLHLPEVNRNDYPNKIGVLVTQAPEQPHTTVLAFLSSEDDDIFLITFPETFKSKLLKRNAHCFFVMDERASFTFDRHIEWNYTIVEAEATTIARGTPLFEEVREGFIRKNPWEIGFFIREDLEMYHLRRQRILCPGEFRPTPGL